MAESTDHPHLARDGGVAPVALTPGAVALTVAATEEEAAGVQQPAAEGALLLVVALVPLLLAVGGLVWR